MLKEEHPLYPPSVFFGLALENVNSLSYGEAELGLLGQVSQVAFSQGEFFSERGTFRAWEGCGDVCAFPGLVWFKCGLVSSNY